jgi:hypothetical protein
MGAGSSPEPKPVPRRPRQLDAPNLKITVRAGDSYATRTVTLRRKKKSGAAMFP